MMMRSRHTTFLTTLAVLLLLLVANGCAGSKAGKQPGNRSGEDESGQPDDWGGGDKSSGAADKDLPALDYNARIASPTVTETPGAGEVPALESEVVRIVVDQNHANASDNNPGTPDAPLKTIDSALKLARQKANGASFIHVRIHEGVYREHARLSMGKDPDTKLLIEGIGDVAIDGSEIYTGWQSAGNGRFTHSWQFDWGLVTETEAWKKQNEWMKEKHRDWIKNSGPLFKRREIVIVNGDVMRQVLSSNELADGTYFVDETNDKLWLDLPAGLSLNDATIEVGERPLVFELMQAMNTTLRNITFQHAATMVEQRAAWIRGCENLLLENCRFNTNNYRGLGLYNSKNVTLRDCEANNNGAQGIDMAYIIDLLIEDCVTNENNWRGDWGETYSWAIAGIKILNTANTIIRNHEAVDNLTFGIWFDHDNLHVLIDNCVMKRNYVDGLFLEATRGPILVTNCEIDNNNVGGVRIANSRRIALVDNQIIGNGRNQIYLRGYGRMIDTRVTGQTEEMDYRQLTFRNNTIVATAPAQNLFWTNINQQQMKPFLQSVESDYNTWVHPKPNACIEAGNKRFGFDVWQELVEGSHSTIRAEQ